MSPILQQATFDLIVNKLLEAGVPLGPYHPVVDATSAHATLIHSESAAPEHRWSLMVTSVGEDPDEQAAEHVQGSFPLRRWDLATGECHELVVTVIAEGPESEEWSVDRPDIEPIALTENPCPSFKSQTGRRTYCVLEAGHEPPHDFGDQA